MDHNKNDPIAGPQRNPVERPAGSRKALFPELARTADEPARVLTLWLVYTLEVLAFAALRIPHDLGFFMFAFGDRGSWLVVQYLTAHGYRPTIDFGFPYGLLPVMFGRAWFGMLGLTPAAFQLAMVAGGVAMAWGMARFASAMRLSRIGQALMIVALPVAIQSSLPSLSHLLEAVLLCLAIAEHSRGRRAAALALTTAACFAKPALGYVYGFLLIVLIVAKCWRGSESGGKSRFDWRDLGRTLTPAAVTGTSLLLIIGSVYGIRPLVSSVLPLNGLKIYKELDFGFFSPFGRMFWDMPGASIGDYFATVVPFWIGSTLWLAIAGPWAGWRLWMADRRDVPGRGRDEIIFCCAVLQTLFVLRFFGPPMSWTYYPYLLVIGVAATSASSSGPAVAALALALTALVSQAVSGAVAVAQWKNSAPSPVTAGLWANSSERAEWSTVERLIAGRRTVAVSVAGCASILFPDFEKPIGAYLVLAEATPAEVDQTIKRISAAERVVRPASLSNGDPITFWPELTRTLDNLEVVWKGRVYQVCRRR